MRDWNSARGARDSRLQAGARYARNKQAAAHDAVALLGAESALKERADHHWPLIVRRVLPGDTCEVPVGLPLPPSAGNLSIARQVYYVDFASAPPPLCVHFLPSSLRCIFDGFGTSSERSDDFMLLPSEECKDRSRLVDAVQHFIRRSD
jgi:hypothetical protein